MPLGNVIVRKSTAPRFECKPIEKAAGDNAADVARLRRLATQLKPEIATAFLQAVEQLRDKIDLKELVDLLAQGRTQEAIARVQSAVTQGGWQQLANTVSRGALEAALTGMRTAVADVPFTQLETVFSVTNPKTVGFLNQYEMQLIRQLADDSLSSVRRAILDGVSAGRNPLDVARDVRRFIGLTDTQTQAVQNFRRLLENQDRDVLARALRDKRFDPTVRAWLDGDLDLKPEQVDRMVDRYTDRYLKYRSETIARTEAIRATQVGNHQIWQQAVDSGQFQAMEVRRSWIYTHDGRARDAHIAIPSMNPDGVGLNEPFQTPLGPLMYPGDPAGVAANTINCRCAVIYRYVPLAGRGYSVGGGS